MTYIQAIGKTKNRGRIALLIGWLATLLLLAAAGCSRPPKLHEIDGFAEGTTYHITWWSSAAVDREGMSQDIQSALRAIDREISTYRDDSDLQRFNYSRSTEWKNLPSTTIALLQIARPIYRDSSGCYDPTVGPLFKLWGFHSGAIHVPTDKEIAELKKTLGFDHIEVDAAENRARKTIPQLAVDLSSMGEGYSIWRLSRVLEKYGVHNYIVEFGGDMLVKGHKPGPQKWRIAIARPQAGQMQAQDIVTIKNEGGVSINTSGTYQRFFDKNGKTYSHILDPRTGRPVNHHTVSATVINTDPRVGDAWATAMLCMGESEGKAVAQKADIKVYFIQNENGKLVAAESKALTQSTDVTITPAE